jgi:hypothetical protein
MIAVVVVSGTISTAAASLVVLPGVRGIMPLTAADAGGARGDVCVSSMGHNRTAD